MCGFDRTVKELLQTIRVALDYGRITKRQYKVIRGQALSGDLDGAIQGLTRMVGRMEDT